MTKYAYVTNGVVEMTSLVQPADMTGWQTCPDDVEPDWLYDGTTFTAPPPPLPSISSLEQYASELMHTTLRTGFSFDAGSNGENGVGAKTYSAHMDEDGELDSAPSVNALLKNSGFTQGDYNWFDPDEHFSVTASDGTEVKMDAQGFSDWYQKYSQVRRRLMKAKKKIVVDINADPATITTTAQIDSSTHWPT